MSLEKLDLSVALKLAFVEDSLSKVLHYKQQLHENAQKVKEEIHEVVDRQVGSLRMRERQLVRQVEVVTAHETCRLSTQQARLMHSKGALTATSDLLDGCINSESTGLAKIKVDEMFYSQEVQPAKHVSAQLDESGLASAISQFGCVQLPDTITHHPSPVIPVKVEEYEDAEHHVLHKSVARASSEPSAPISITVQFPRLSNNAWLFKQNNISDSQTSSKPVGGQDNQSGDVAAWLRDLKLSSAPAGDQCSDDFDMVSTPSHSEGSSIEIVDQFMDKECAPLSSGICEIENLHHLVNEKSRWLSTKTPEDTNKEEGKLDITSVCMANEPCKTFSECLCQNKCRETALEKLRQSADYRAKTSRKRTISEVDGINSILKHMSKILASENSQWLLKKPELLEQPRPAKSVMYTSPGDTWLHRKGFGSPIKTFPRAQPPSQCNTWLLKNIKNQKNNQEKDENKKEKGMEEDNRITSETLAESLKRVCVDPMRRNHDENKSHLYNASPTACRDQPWLLPRKLDSNKPTFNDQNQEKMISKPVWLFSPQESRSGKGEITVQQVSTLLQESLSPSHIKPNSWILH